MFLLQPLIEIEEEPDVPSAVLQPLESDKKCQKGVHDADAYDYFHP